MIMNFILASGSRDAASGLIAHPSTSRCDRQATDADQNSSGRRATYTLTRHMVTPPDRLV
jgi:hypothetical protein